MSPTTFAWFAIGAIIIYAVIADANIYDWLVLLSKRATQLVQLQWFKVRYHPETPWVRYEIKRNSEKLAEEFLRQYKQEQEQKNDR